MATALRHYKKIDTNLEECEPTARFCERINSMFDALNRMSREKGVTVDSNDFKVSIILEN